MFVSWVAMMLMTLYTVEDPEEGEDAGTPAIVQKIRAAMDFQVKDWVGNAMIQRREQRMVRLVKQRMLRNSRVRVLTVGTMCVFYIQKGRRPNIYIVDLLPRYEMICSGSNLEEGAPVQDPIVTSCLVLIITSKRPSNQQSKRDLKG